VSIVIDNFIVSNSFLFFLSLQHLWLEIVDEENPFYWNKLDLKAEDFPPGPRLALLFLFSTMFDPGSPIARFADEWDKSFNILNILKQLNPDKISLNALLQPARSKLVYLQEVEFLPPAVVSHAIYHYF
jgi:hypothetical protein